MGFVTEILHVISIKNAKPVFILVWVVNHIQFSERWWNFCIFFHESVFCRSVPTVLEKMFGCAWCCTVLAALFVHFLLVRRQRIFCVWTGSRFIHQTATGFVHLFIASAVLCVQATLVTKVICVSERKLSQSNFNSVHYKPILFIHEMCLCINIILL